MIYIGCAGWAIRSEHRELFPVEGTHLERYSTVFNCVEINSCFYRSHKPQTYEKWSKAVPLHFRFAVKVERTMTHERGLRDCHDLLAKYLDEVQMLGDRLGPILVQLPPKLSYEPTVVRAFFTQLRAHYAGAVVCEPRHKTWFTEKVKSQLESWRIGLVAADPTINANGLTPEGDLNTRYYRLHGSPKMYESRYSEAYLDGVAADMQAQTEETVQSWCIFDNTALGYATVNALELMKRVDADFNLPPVTYAASSGSARTSTALEF